MLKDYEKEKQLKEIDTFLKELQRGPLKEELCSASLSDLDKQIEADADLKRLLTTKAINLPKKYKFLVDEVFAESDEVSLYDLIKQSQAKLGSDKVFFSKSGEKINGWAGYDTDIFNKKVMEIKMFSFDITRPNPVLIKDLRKLLEKLLSKYEEVSWAALKANPANKIYKAAVSKYHGQFDDSDEKIIVYTIRKQVN